jgi:hypothetical protein
MHDDRLAHAQVDLRPWNRAVEGQHVGVHAVADVDGMSFGGDAGFEDVRIGILVRRGRHDVRIQSRGRERRTGRTAAHDQERDHRQDRQRKREAAPPLPDERRHDCLPSL